MSHGAVSKFSIRSPCAAGNELEISRAMFYVIFYYEYHYSPHKLTFQNIMRAGDQKLMINLEWPNNIMQSSRTSTVMICRP